MSRLTAIAEALAAKIDEGILLDKEDNDHFEAKGEWVQMDARITITLTVDVAPREEDPDAG